MASRCHLYHLSQALILNAARAPAFMQLMTFYSQQRVVRLSFDAGIMQHRALSQVSSALIGKKPTLLAFGVAACRGRFGQRQVPTKLVHRHLQLEAARWGGKLVLTPENRFGISLLYSGA